MPASKDDVQRVLGEYHHRIRAVVERAWNDWLRVGKFMSDESLGPVLYSRTIVNFVFDGIARHAIAEFGEDDSVTVKIESQTVKFIFRGAVIGRFKKGNDNKLGQNITTQANMAFIDAQGIFPGLPPETAKVEFVWLPNELLTNLDEILVVARHNHCRIWDYPIAPADDAGEVVELMPHDPSPDGGGDDDLVKPKVPDHKDADSE